MKRCLAAAALPVAIGLALGACKPAGQDAVSPAAASQDATAAVATAEPAAAAATAAAALPAAATDLEQLAQRLVTRSAAVKEGEIVLITGRPHDAELLENIAVHVRKGGAFPMITYSSDRLAKRLFFDVPAQYDGQADALGGKLAGMVDAAIIVNNNLSENLFESADPKRMAARNQADEPVFQAFMKNNVCTIEVGNNLYPTPWRAERMGMDQAALAAGNEVRITNPNGTDLKLRVQGRPVLVSDGLLSDADQKAGGAATTRCRTASTCSCRAAPSPSTARPSSKRAN